MAFPAAIWFEYRHNGRNYMGHLNPPLAERY
jgi:hypothetical protein